MVPTGITRNSRKQQRISAELETIIEEFGTAMRNANRTFVRRLPVCQHDTAPRFTLAMGFAWSKYVDYCQRHPE